VKGDFDITVGFAVLPPTRGDQPVVPAELRLLVVPHEPVAPATWHQASHNRAGVLRVVAGPGQAGQLIAQRAQWTGDIPKDKWGNESFGKVEQHTNQAFPATAAAGRVSLRFKSTLRFPPSCRHFERFATFQPYRPALYRV